MFGDMQVDQNKLQEELEDHQNTFDHDHCLMDLISKLTASTAAKSQQEDSEACTAFNSGYNGYFGQLRACQASPYMGRVLPEPSTIVPFQMTTWTQTAEPPTLKNGMTNRYEEGGGGLRQLELQRLQLGNLLLPRKLSFCSR